MSNNMYKYFLKNDPKGFIEEMDKLPQIKEMPREKKAGFVFMITIAVILLIPMIISGLLEIIFPSITRAIPAIISACVGFWICTVSLRIIVRIKNPNIDALIKERQSKK